MTDLNDLLPPSRSFDYGIHNPVNVWMGASADVYVNVQWFRNGVICQQGWNIEDPTVLWSRSRAPDGTWSAWTASGGDTGNGTEGTDGDGEST